MTDETKGNTKPRDKFFIRGYQSAMVILPDGRYASLRYNDAGICIAFRNGKLAHTKHKREGIVQ